MILRHGGLLDRHTPYVLMARTFAIDHETKQKVNCSHFALTIHSMSTNIIPNNQLCKYQLLQQDTTTCVALLSLNLPVLSLFLQSLSLTSRTKSPNYPIITVYNTQGLGHDVRIYSGNQQI